MRRLHGDAWLAVPAIAKWVAVDLTVHKLPGWRAARRALSLPELRAFARAAAALDLDVTAPSGEWTSTCVIRHVDRVRKCTEDKIAHHCKLEPRGDHWLVVSCDSPIHTTRLPHTGWALGGQGHPWYDSASGLPYTTTERHDFDPGGLSLTGFSYFWSPDPVSGVTLVIRECERLRDQVMDICASMDPSFSHEDIRLRDWMPLTGAIRTPCYVTSRPDDVANEH